MFSTCRILAGGIPERANIYLRKYLCFFPTPHVSAKFLLSEFCLYFSDMRKFKGFLFEFLLIFSSNLLIQVCSMDLKVLTDDGRFAV